MAHRGRSSTLSPIADISQTGSKIPPSPTFFTFLFPSFFLAFAMSLSGVRSCDGPGSCAKDESICTLAVSYFLGFEFRFLILHPLSWSSSSLSWSPSPPFFLLAPSLPFFLPLPTSPLDSPLLCIIITSLLPLTIPRRICC